MAVLQAAPAGNDLVLRAGDGFSLRLVFVDAVTGAPVDMTGSWKAQIRAAKDSPTVLADFDVTTSQAAAGVVYLAIPGAVSSSLAGTVGAVWDVQYVAPDSIEPRTWAAGTVNIWGDVTR